MARATSSVARIGFHTKATQKEATLEQKHPKIRTYLVIFVQSNSIRVRGIDASRKSVRFVPSQCCESCRPQRWAESVEFVRSCSSLLSLPQHFVDACNSVDRPSFPSSPQIKFCTALETSHISDASRWPMCIAFLRCAARLWALSEPKPSGTRHSWPHKGRRVTKVAAYNSGAQRVGCASVAWRPRDAGMRHRKQFE